MWISPDSRICMYPLTYCMTRIIIPLCVVNLSIWLITIILLILSQSTASECVCVRDQFVCHHRSWGLGTHTGHNNDASCVSPGAGRDMTQCRTPSTTSSTSPTYNWGRSSAINAICNFLYLFDNIAMGYLSH